MAGLKGFPAFPLTLLRTSSQQPIAPNPKKRWWSSKEDYFLSNECFQHSLLENSFQVIDIKNNYPI